ncbi:hypothetical protein JZ751_012696, partial [Albula glossodonta]
MVKISFNPTLGQKDEKKEEERGEVLIPEYRERLFSDRFPTSKGLAIPDGYTRSQGVSALPHLLCDGLVSVTLLVVPGHGCVGVGQAGFGEAVELALRALSYGAILRRLQEHGVLLFLSSLSSSSCVRLPVCIDRTGSDMQSVIDPLSKVYAPAALHRESAVTDLEDGVRVQRQSRVCCWFMCLGLAIMLLVVGGVCVFRYLILQRAEEFCILYPEDYSGELEIAAPVPYRLLQERVQILQDNEVELISVPVPEFGDSDPADIVHDFPRKLTAYLDLSLNRCYIIPLNTSIVMPPKDFLELLVNIKAGTYLPQSYLVHEQMMVTERVDNVDQLGYFIYNLCHG